MRRYSLFFVVALVFFIDRLTKFYVENSIPEDGSVSLLPFFSVVHVKNYGGAFSILSSSKYATLIFTLLPLAVITFLVLYLLKVPLPAKNKFPLLLIIGGAIGNLYERIEKGYVTDFLDFHLINFHWPAFNVADASITVGVGLWIFFEMGRGRRGSIHG